MGAWCGQLVMEVHLNIQSVGQIWQLHMVRCRTMLAWLMAESRLTWA